jgi:hypothetical protein
MIKISGLSARAKLAKMAPAELRMRGIGNFGRFGTLIE